MSVSLRKALVQEAEQLSVSLERQGKAAEAKLVELHHQKAKLEAQVKTADLASQRLLKYPMVIDGYFQCPSCWVQHEQRTTLRPIADVNEDILKCRSCGFSVSVSADG